MLLWFLELLSLLDIGEQHLFGLLLTVIGAFFLAFATGKVPFIVNVEEPAAAEGHRTQFAFAMSAHGLSKNDKKVLGN